MRSHGGSWRRCAVLLLLIWSAGARADETVSIVPVVSARNGDYWYRTTLVLRAVENHATCEASYALPGDAQDGTIRAAYEVGKVPTVEEDLLAEIGAVGTLRVVCAGKVDVASLIEMSTDGVTFKRGWVYARVAEGPGLRAGEGRTVSPLRDVLVAEVEGLPVTVDVVVRDGNADTLATRRYSVPAFAHQIVNLSEARAVSRRLAVEVRVTSGTGAVVVADESRDPILLAALDRTAHVAVTKQATTPQAPGNQALHDVGSAAFKAAPLRDPATGLVYMRNRWYDPTVGSFLSPDPLGYRDSSNLYSYCGGDPVNCSDPTGLAASVSKSGVITGIRPDGTRYRIEPGTDPVVALRVLESDADLKTAADQEGILARAGIRVPYSSACRPGETCLSSSKPNDRAYERLPPGEATDFFVGVAVPDSLPVTSAQMARGRGYGQAGRAVANLVGVPAAGAKARAQGGGRGAMPVDVFNQGRLRAEVPVDMLGPPAPDQPKRLQYMGNTPSRLSSTGVEVMVRMFHEGGLRVGVSGLEVKTQEGNWIALKQTDMSHIEAAVTYWNREGYKTGPRSDDVYAFMRDPANYILEQSNVNRARKPGETYRPPYKP